MMTVSATRMGTPFPMAAGSFHQMLLVTVRGGAFRIAVIEAGNIYPTEYRQIRGQWLSILYSINSSAIPLYLLS